MNAGKSVFIHSHLGSGKTATFFSMMTFVRRRKQFERSENADLRQTMAEILEEVVKGGYCSVPNQFQIDFLLDVKTLESLVNLKIN